MHGLEDIWQQPRGMEGSTATCRGHSDGALTAAWTQPRWLGADTWLLEHPCVCDEALMATQQHCLQTVSCTVREKKCELNGWGGLGEEKTDGAVLLLDHNETLYQTVAFYLWEKQGRKHL